MAIQSKVRLAVLAPVTIWVWALVQWRILVLHYNALQRVVGFVNRGGEFWNFLAGLSMQGCC